eukprot:TRINITY_DN11203_c1_g1_i1.p1 TRINITY_DN11203_c1_g1~~TRINITY_DN11203_c1_g1_i1.p1  ORF type:complete len:259 (-),score=80.41 TRINITY_DN11203_c1_g1_i1:98-826(-)
MASCVAVMSPSRRGFQALKPPPEGCIGWGPQPPTTATETVAAIEDAATADGAPAAIEDAQAAEDSKQAQLVPVETAVPDQAQTTQDMSCSPQVARLKEKLEPELNPAHLGPLQDLQHLKIATKGSVEDLQEFDKRLKQVVADDQNALAKDPATKEAFKLYMSSLLAFDPGPEARKLAFKAITRDNLEELRWLLESGGLEWDAKNSGGQSLLEVAIERERPDCVALIEEAKKRQEGASEQKAG